MSEAVLDGSFAWNTSVEGVLVDVRKAFLDGSLTGNARVDGVLIDVGKAVLDRGLAWNTRLNGVLVEVSVGRLVTMARAGRGVYSSVVVLGSEALAVLTLSVVNRAGEGLRSVDGDVRVSLNVLGGT